MNKPTQNQWNKELVVNAIKDAFLKLAPHRMIKNFVMFVTYLGAIITTILLFFQSGNHLGFNLQISIWLWFTVIFANFSEALAEGRGRAQAQSLRKTRSTLQARKYYEKEGREETVSATELRKGDLAICYPNDLIPADGEIVEGITTIDESAITGESAPVVRESGGDRSAVTAGTRVLSDKIKIKVTAAAGESFLDRMISLVESSKRGKTPNEIALSMVLVGLTAIFLLAIGALKFQADFSATQNNQNLNDIVTIPVLIALLVCLIPTTIGGLLSAIGISGMDRLIRKNVIAMSGKAVEAAGDIDVLLLDKTGTITFGNRMATEFFPEKSVTEAELARYAQLTSLSDETPEGRSIVILAKEKFGLREEIHARDQIKFIPFSAQTRMSGVDVVDNQSNTEVVRKGAVDAVRKHIESLGGTFPKELANRVDEISKKGGTPLLVSKGNTALGLIYLKDVVKGGIKERFAELRKMGIRTVMITGDNALTAAAIAAEAGVDDFLAQATPEDKLKKIRDEQSKGFLVAMTGDGTNDAPALAQADVGVAMNTGTQAAREAGNMIDLDSNPTKLIEIVETGKQLLMTRGALTTFSVANDVAKYFAIIPALFGSLYAASALEKGPLSALNFMHLATPQSAILSAVIFNALIIIALVPLALKGISYKPKSASAILKKNLFVYGFGGIVAPFLGIKCIDIFVSLFI